jgi:hypothetical protein
MMNSYAVDITTSTLAQTSRCVAAVVHHITTLELTSESSHFYDDGLPSGVQIAP